MGGVADPPPTVGIEPWISALAEVDDGPVAGSPLLSFTMWVYPLWSLSRVSKIIRPIKEDSRGQVCRQTSGGSRHYAAVRLSRSAGETCAGVSMSCACVLVSYLFCRYCGTATATLLRVRCL